MTASARCILRVTATLVSVMVSLTTAENAVPPLTGSGIEAQVVDRTGAVISGAKVSLTDETNKVLEEEATDAYGISRALRLAPGSYLLRVDHPGFSALNQIVRVDSGAVLKLRLALAFAPLTPTVRVLDNHNLTFLSSNPVDSLPIFELRRRSLPTLNDIGPPRPAR